jgi:hypothetical protein
MSVGTIILGDGIFALDGTDIARTRGGGTFAIEREYREIEADGDYGPVKGRLRKIRSVAKLTLNALTILSTNLDKFYPATEVDTSGAGVNVWKAKADIEDSDYQPTVSWTGFTKSGLQVYIELQDGINLENIDWSLVDKDEVVPQLVYTATYDENNRTVEPWNVEYAKGDTYTVTFTVDDGATEVAGASVRFANTTVTTSALGVAEFTNVAIGDNQEVKVTAGGFLTYFGAIDVVNVDVTETLSLTAI